MPEQVGWCIADVSRFVDTWDEDDPGYEYIEVASGPHLEAVLRRSMTPVGTVLSLQSDGGVKLGIGLSDRFGWLTLLRIDQRVQRRVRPRDVTAAEPCLFRSEGVVSEVLPEDLLPAEDVIRLALFFVENSAFPGTVVLDPP